MPSTSSDPSLENTVFKVGELYSGPGGVGMGAAQAEVIKDGHRYSTAPVWVNDFDSDSCETWERNVLRYYREHKGYDGDCSVMHGDVRAIDIDALADVDGLMFGFPCNDFSIVGEHKGFDGEYGPLYSYGVKVLQKANQPKWFLAENVGGITSSNEGFAFEKILSDLTDAGYEITAHKYKLEEYGVPQARHRVIIVGFRNDLNLKFEVPAPTGERVTAGQALTGIPEWATNQERTKQSARVEKRLSYIKPGENVWNAKDLPEELRLNVPRTQLSHIYKRLDPNRPSYTVTGSGGGGTHMYHWSENRALTNRERACLQTFPLDFNFYGSKESVRKQIGMAIPVKGAKLIVESILKTFAGEPYESVKPNLQAKT
ncbi:DNA cytosine methyltransferase [Luminiphilus sp.]|nr:DNA cytosine methyltransferase [Luminiphilus sp.]